MSRLGAIFGVELAHTFRRPLFIILALILLLSGWGLSTGNVQISSGDSSVGGTKAWITSEFAQTQMMTYIVLLYYAFFIAIGAGLSLIRDRETKVDALLYSTPLTAGEYVWGRYLAIVAGFVVLLTWQVLVNAFFNHAVPNAGANEIRGPFSLASYVLPVLTIGLPFLIFYAGLALYVGQRTQNGILVFFMSVAMLLICGFFLWTWSPSWLDWRVNRLLQVLDPSGYRWLNEALLKVDRGVAYYNRAHVSYDGLFWINRLAMIAIGLGSVVLTQRSVARAKRGIAESRVKQPKVRSEAAAPALSPWPEGAQGLTALHMQAKRPSFLGTVRAVAGAEMRELSRQKGLYVFIPLILIQALGNGLIAVGAFDTPVLLTPGISAVQLANQVSGWIGLLLMFYTVESLERERAAGLASIIYASPIKTGAFLAGKALANATVGGAVLAASTAGSNHR